jgi:hypothetical protein
VFIHRRLDLSGRPVGNFKLCTLPSDNIEYDDDVANGQTVSSPSEADDDEENVSDDSEEDNDDGEEADDGQ